MWFCFLVPSAAVISTIMWEQGAGVVGGQRMCLYLQEYVSLYCSR